MRAARDERGPRLPPRCLCGRGPHDELQAVVTNLGVGHSRISKVNRENGKTYDEVYATGEHAKRLADLVPFLEPEKQDRATALSAIEFASSGTADLVPGIAPAELY